MNDAEYPIRTNFVRHIIDEDQESGKYCGRVATRFPPEPNGYLHIGHAKSIVLNFGIADDYKGTCNLRFDDTNPHKENINFVEAIKEDVQWLGYKWREPVFFASNYFDQLYDFAVQLIKKNKAYVDDLSADQIREYRGTLTKPGKNSPHRDRSVDENLNLFQGMKSGNFSDGSKVLRAKIDMTSPNINLRDPTLYRIRHGIIHHQTGAAWCIYPMYDFTHCLSDALEGITHSICTLEFEDHRPLYDWFLDELETECHPQQIEFSRLNLEYTITSKRKLTELVDEGIVEGWDDPRMPTIAGLRRRGYTAKSIRDFCNRIGVTKSENTVEMALLEDCIRSDLNEKAPRRMAVLCPLKVVITNYPADQTETVIASNHPQNENMGTRSIAFCNEIYIDENDFRETPLKNFKRLVDGGEVRLRNAYVIRCDKVVKDGSGNIVELLCSYDPGTLGKKPEGRKVKGVIHWVSANHAVEAEVHLYDRLFNHPTPDIGVEGNDYREHVNPDSMSILSNCYLESALADTLPGDQIQFEREGYFCLDSAHIEGKKPVFNRITTLRDTWAKTIKNLKNGQ